MSELGARIRYLREQRDWTQADLSSKAGVSQSMLSHIETGRRKGNDDDIKEIAAAFNVSMGLLRDPEISLEKLEQVSYILHEVQYLDEPQVEVIRQLISTLKASR